MFCAVPLSRFQELPDHIRKQIWAEIAFEPRVVRIYEYHDEAVIDPSKWEVLMSRSRPPAMLSVCRESRTLGLNWYTTLDKGKHITQDCIPPSHSIPIYINPQVDIIYRGRNSCRRGRAFMIQYLKCSSRYVETGPGEMFSTIKQPIAMSKILAVDLLAILRYDIQLPGHQRAGYIEKGKLDMERTGLTTKQIAECTLAGLRKLLIVVGNDGDLSEVSFAPLPKRRFRTPRENQAVLEAQDVEHNLENYWAERRRENNPDFENLALPEIKVVTVKRPDTNVFTQFRRLPNELQDRVWKFALMNPRVITIRTSPNEYNPFRFHSSTTTNHPPALASVCRASRKIALAQTYSEMPPTDWMWSHVDRINDPPKRIWYNSALDTVRLDVFGCDNYRVCAKFNLETLGIPADCGYVTLNLLGKHARVFTKVREFVLLSGKPLALCEMALVPISDKPDGDEQELLRELEHLAGYLRKELVKASNRWEDYQRQQVKHGRVRPLDWTPPPVRIARMEAIRQAESPYSY